MRRIRCVRISLGVWRRDEAVAERRGRGGSERETERFMINLTRIWTGKEQPADGLRYGRAGCRGDGHGVARSAAGRRPVVVWSITRTCNLRCLHCYADSEPRVYPGELGPEECSALLRDLKGFGVPVVLLSGGEPMAHPRFYEIAEEAAGLGLRLTLSTNGTLIDGEAAARLKGIGFGYVGISLDGIGAVHDFFRGRKGAFELAVRGFRSCLAAGQKCGLRLTLTRHNASEIDRILDFIEAEGIPRACFYHLVPSGRGMGLELLPPDLTRSVLDRILDRIDEWHRAGVEREILTVDQPADAVYVLGRLRERKPERFAEAVELLGWNGGGAHSSGTGIANIDAQGNVHPDQFWQDVTLGNVRERPFSAIWGEPAADGLLARLRERAKYLKGRCAGCAHLRFCGGGFRARAAHVTGDEWAADPGCYLTDQEIARGLN